MASPDVWDIAGKTLDGYMSVQLAKLQANANAAAAKVNARAYQVQPAASPYSAPWNYGANTDDWGWGTGWTNADLAAISGAQPPPPGSAVTRKSAWSAPLLAIVAAGAFILLFLLRK